MRINFLALFLLVGLQLFGQIHPRPDHWRPTWYSLDGQWDFKFDSENNYTRKIQVPFPWGSPLSGVEDLEKIGWYKKTIQVPSMRGQQRLFLIIGAADWETSVYVDGVLLGKHQGGYVPIEFDLTQAAFGKNQVLLEIKVDDEDRAFKLEGKQGYGNARGIWQSVYLEVRGDLFIEYLHFYPEPNDNKVKFKGALNQAAAQLNVLQLQMGDIQSRLEIKQGQKYFEGEVIMPNPILWELNHPYLYDTRAIWANDTLHSYFGMRTISVENLPGTNHRYIALNGKPVYLQMALDQAYHPEGFYQFPDDEFVRDEILRSKEIGLNGMRIHVKVGLPRKLYWADKLGMLIMADVPNSWGEPDENMRKETEYTARKMIERDFNHPSIFSWVIFNETWGLFTNKVYTDETKEWVGSMVKLAKSLDPTRLVEDNSPCCGVGHTMTDINSWHSYRPGWDWENFVKDLTDKTYPGSDWNFEKGYVQANQPNINSEFGNVWGYEGSTGDVDWSWDYLKALNVFRKYAALAGWLYTEHHDVINEWNGYWKFDRTEKFTGFEELTQGMHLKDLHQPLYISVGQEISKTSEPGKIENLDMVLSALCERAPTTLPLYLVVRMHGWDETGKHHSFGEIKKEISVKPWSVESIEGIEVQMPQEPGLFIASLFLEDQNGTIYARNFSSFIVEGKGGKVIFDVKPSEFAKAVWSDNQTIAMSGRKVNGMGSGFFEYEIPFDQKKINLEKGELRLIAELGAKMEFGKDRLDKDQMDGDYMRGKGTFDPSRNPNAYPMTDIYKHKSLVRVYINEVFSGEFILQDDPADSRGILSWHYQERNGRLSEAGSYGYLIEAVVPQIALEAAQKSGTFKLKLEVPASFPNGLAIYGRESGRYMINPGIVLFGE
jgi:hypothetical protein